jgi:hypothetical protein
MWQRVGKVPIVGKKGDSGLPGPAGYGVEELRPVVEGFIESTSQYISKLNAFKQYDPTYQYVGGDPTFFGGLAYYANPYYDPFPLNKSPFEDSGDNDQPYWILASSIDNSGSTNVSIYNAVNKNTSRINQLWAEVFKEIAENGGIPFDITFENLNGIALTKGCWNEELQRIEC